MKDVENGIVIEGVDRCSTWSVARGPCCMVIQKPIDITGEGSVPLPSGLAAYFTLADSSGGLTMGCS